MHTLPAPAPLTDLLQAQAGALTGAARLGIRLLAYRWLALPLRARIKSQLDGLAQNHLATELMLKGLLSDVSAQAGAAEWANDAGVDAVITTLQTAEVTLLDIRSSYLASAAQPWVRRDPILHGALARLSAANADAFEAAQTLRWELMELQADADIQAGRVDAFATANDAIAFLAGPRSAHP